MNRILSIFLKISFMIAIIAGVMICLLTFIFQDARLTSGANAETLASEGIWNQTIYEAGTELVEADKDLQITLIELEAGRAKADHQAHLAALQEELAHQQRLYMIQQQLRYYFGSAGILILVSVVIAALILLVGAGLHRFKSTSDKQIGELREVKRQLARINEQVNLLREQLAQKSSIRPAMIPSSIAKEDQITWLKPQSLTNTNLGTSMKDGQIDPTAG